MRGVGVCDAFILELQPVQLAWLIDELEEPRGPLDEALQHARGEPAASVGSAVDEEVRALEHQLRQLRGLRDQLPPAGHRDPVSFVCPGAQARDLIRTTARNAIAALAELVDGPTTNHEKGRARLRATAEATTAWIQTLLDYQAVEGFSFDPSTNPLAEW